MFLVGKFDSKKFSQFIDDVLSDFSFKTVAYIQDDSKHNEAGVLFKHRALLLKDNPEHLFVMRYRVCSSFPLHDIVNFHKEKERECEKMQAERAK